MLLVHPVTPRNFVSSTVHDGVPAEPTLTRRDPVVPVSKKTDGTVGQSTVPVVPARSFF